MDLPISALTKGVRYKDAECAALLQGLRRGTALPQPVLLAFTGAPKWQLGSAAQDAAKAMGRSLQRLDLAQVVGKYIGETEKNLDRLFARAEGADAVLLFDEADALFGRSSEVKDAHDRYANLEVSYLLARLEAYRGVLALVFSSTAEAQKPRGRLRPVVVRFPPA